MNLKEHYAFKEKWIEGIKKNWGKVFLEKMIIITNKTWVTKKILTTKIIWKTKRYPRLPARLVRYMAISITTNVASSISKPPTGGRFELKQGMVQLLHFKMQFTGFHYEDPDLQLRKFIEITHTYIQTEVLPYYVKLTMFPTHC